MGIKQAHLVIPSPPPRYVKEGMSEEFFYTPSTVRLGDLECFPGSNLYIFCLVFDLLKFFVNYEKNQQNKTVSAMDLAYFMLFKYLQGSSPMITCGYGWRHNLSLFTC